MSQRGGTGSDVRRASDGKWLPGSSANPSGQTKAMAEIQAMLNAEHRTAANMREVFARLKSLALGEIVTVTDREGNVDLELKADARFMQLYLDRTLGPVKELDVDLTGVSPEALAELRGVLKQ